MGIMNDLSKGFLPPATKLTKYKQIKLLGTVVDKLAADDYLICKGGFCAAASCQWINYMAEQTPAGALSKTTESIMEATGVFAKVGRDGSQTKLFRIMSEYGLEPLEEQKLYTGSSHAAWLTRKVMEQKTESTYGLIIAYRKVGENADGEGHAVAAKWSGGGDKRACYFFDPNFGEYMIMPKDVDRFFRIYFDRVKAEFKSLDNWLLFIPVCQK